MICLILGLKRKRKLDSEPNINVLRPLQEHMQGNRQQCNIINNWPLDIKEEPLDAQPNVSPSYLGHSPSYGNPSVSPNYYPPGPIAGANIPVPQTDPNYQYCQQHIPHMNDFQQHQEPQWNVPMAGPSQMPPHEQHQHQQQPQSDMPMSIELNLDAPLLNSKELAQYKFDPNALSENLSNSLLISDLPSTAMTSDSLSKLAEATYDKFFTQSTQQ